MRCVFDSIHIRIIVFSSMSNERYRSLVAVYVMVVNERQELLVLRRANTSYRDGFYDMPAGHLENGETLSQAAARELAEETGLQVSQGDLEFVELLHRQSSNDLVYIDVFFRAKKWEGDPRIMEPEKCDDLSWFSMDALPENIVPHQRQVLQDQMDGCTYRELFDQV